MVATPGRRGRLLWPGERDGELEINALHALGALADELSTTVLPVSYTSLEGAKALVAAGVAEKSDFGCALIQRWAPGQPRWRWRSAGLASADSGTLPKEPSAVKAAVGRNDDRRQRDGTWNTPMRGIGRRRRRRRPPSPMISASGAAPPFCRCVADADGGAAGGSTRTVLLTDVSAATADRRPLLREQYLHKALLLVVSEAGGVVSAVVLNRPTASIMFKTVGGKTRRRFTAAAPSSTASSTTEELGGEPSREGLATAGDRRKGAPRRGGRPPTSSSRAPWCGARRTRRDARGGRGALPPGDRPDDLWLRVWALTDESGDGSGRHRRWWPFPRRRGGERAAVRGGRRGAGRGRKWFALEA